MDKSCANCGYCGLTANTITCDQILFTHSRRPCPAGDPNCPRWISEADFRTGVDHNGSDSRKNISIAPRDEIKTEKLKGVSMERKKLNTEFAWQLYDKGQNDCEIGRMLGVSSNTVRSWRVRSGLEPNARPGVQACAEKAPAMATSGAVTPEEHEKLAALIRDKLGEHGTASAGGYTSSVTDGDTLPSRGRQDEKTAARRVVAPYENGGHGTPGSSRPTEAAEGEDGEREKMSSAPKKPYCMTVGGLTKLLLELLKDIPNETEIHNSCGDNITGLGVSKIFNSDGSFDDVDVYLTTEGD